MLAVWDTCGGSASTTLIDPMSGVATGSLAMTGGPAWSPDGTKVASLGTDGVLRVATAATGEVRAVKDLHIDVPLFDSCGIGARVLSWSPDARSLLVEGLGPIGVVRSDGSKDRVLVDHTPSAGPGWAAARWLPDDEVIVVEDSEGSKDIRIRRGDPWGRWPPSARSIPAPTGTNLSGGTISPLGDRLAAWTWGPGASPGKGSVVVVDLANGASRSISGDQPAGDLVFSRDGTQVAYYCEGRNGLVVAPVSGAGDRTYDAIYSSRDVAWSLDDQSIVVGSNPPSRVDLATGAVTPLGDGSSESVVPSLDWG